MPTGDHEEFFIGYEPPMPRGLARFVKRVVIGLACVALVWAGALAAGHLPIDGGAFEFGYPRTFAGTIVERPYPALRPDGVEAGAERWLLLVAPGKHGADRLVRGLEGRRVTLNGTRIRRGAHEMIEIEPASLSTAPSQVAAEGSADSEQSGEGLVELTGEIVDSKCFLGVMVPGSGKTHKECASLCLRGGIPPAFHVQDRAGRSSLLLLTGPSGESTGPATLKVAGDAIALTGSIRRQSGWLMLRTDPGSWRTIGR